MKVTRIIFHGSKNQIMHRTVLTLIFILAMVCRNVSAQDTVADELNKAMDLLRQGQKTEASAILGEIMKAHPHNKTAVQYWLIANMKRVPDGELQAIGQLDSLAVQYPGNTGIIFFRTFIQAEYGKSEEALAGFESLIRLQPDTAVNYIGKGQVLSSINRHEEALLAFDKATMLDPMRMDVWGMKASSLVRLNRYDEALAAIGKAVELAPDNPVNLYNRACIFCLTGDRLHALADLKTACEKMPRLKESARRDEDFRSLWEDEEFRKVTQ